MLELPRFGRALTAAALLSLPLPAAALERVSLDPVEHTDAELVVDATGGEQVFSPAALEAIGAMRLVTTTPWRSEPTAFEGVLLQDLLTMTGLSSASGIRIVAENDWAVEMPRAIWESTPILVATRVNGAPHSRRERGPIQFIIPMEDYQSNPEMRESYWVWMAARIEPME